MIYNKTVLDNDCLSQKRRHSSINPLNEMLMKKFTFFVMMALMSSTLFAQRPLSPKAGVRANMVEKTMDGRWSKMLPRGAKATGFRMAEHLSATTSAQKRAAKADAASSMITETPEGRAESYLKTGFSYYVFWNYVFTIEVTAGVGDLVFDDDNSTVYIKNPYYYLPTDTWLKGTLKDDKIVVSLPQKIFEEEYQGELYEYYANKVDYDEEEGWYFQTEGDNEITFTKVNGVWNMDEDAVLGLTDEAGEWMGYGDFAVSYEKFDEVPVTAPEGTAFEKWVIDNGDGSGLFVNVGFSGNDVYLGGLYSAVPDGVFKGEKDGDKVVFKSGQYVGPSMDYMYYSAANVEEQWDDYYEEYVDVFVPTDKAEFVYDAENKSMSSEGNLGFVAGADGVDFYYAVKSPVIKWQAPLTKATKPQNPEFYYFSEYNDESGYGYVAFVLPQFDVEGNLLDTKNLSYQMFIDDEPYTFYTDEYVAFDEDMDVLPYDFTDSWDVFADGVEHTVYFYTTGFEKIGVQLINTFDGVEEKSDIVYYDVLGTAVDSVTSAPAESTSYFDVAGRKISAPVKGISLKSVKYADGTVKTVKVIK